MNGGARWDFIYNAINGLCRSDVCEWVQDESSMEGALGPLVGQIYETRNRLSERLGVEPDNDPDLEQLIEGIEEFARACGKLMYHYGYQDGENLK